MRPFQQFRLWSRRAPLGDRVSAATAAAVVLALLVWAMVPSSKSASPSALTGPATGAPSAPGGVSATTPATTGAGAVTGQAGSVAGSTGPRPAGASTVPPAAAGSSGRGPQATGSVPSAGAGARCTSPPGSDVGVSATQIKLAISITSIAGAAGNSTFGIASPQEQEKAYSAVIDAINKAGGVACRKVVPTFYEVNPGDANDEQAKCLSIVASGAFAVLDSGGYYQPPSMTCFGQHKMPFFGTGLIDAQQQKTYYPYLFNLQQIDVLYRNAAFALRDRGYFSAAHGFRNLGFIYQDCIPGLAQKIMGWLKQAGAPANHLWAYNVGCPTAYTSPSILAQAVLYFQQHDVTNVTVGQFVGDFSNFTTIAQQQGFKPIYGLVDDGLIATAYGSQHPDYRNLAGALMIAASRYGEEHTPGIKQTPGTRACNAIFAARGLKPVYEQPSGVGGIACDQLWMLTAAVTHAPSLRRASLADGLRAARSVDFSYPYGPNDFTAPGTTTGGQAWRPLSFLESCSCWRVLTPTFRGNYP